VTHAIETHGLCRRFERRTVVDNVSLQVPSQSIYGFLGRNGAGKTTTLKMLLGLLRPDAGSAWIDGIDVSANRLAAARKVGALLEAHGFYGNLSGRENLDLTRRLLGCPASEVARVLEVVQLSTHARRRVDGYSLGMRQRLGLARAMLGKPTVLILDEPTNGLDPEGIADMRQLLRELPRRTGATVLLSSHLLGEIEHVASHVGILSHGRLVLQGELTQLKSRLAAEILIDTDEPARAASIAISHGFDVAQVADQLIVRLATGESPRTSAAVLTSTLCAAGLSIFAITPRVHSLESLYHRSAQALSV
jgi:ABC-type multidrug transport system ATPase subunit